MGCLGVPNGTPPTFRHCPLYATAQHAPPTLPSTLTVRSGYSAGALERRDGRVDVQAAWTTLRPLWTCSSWTEPGFRLTTGGAPRTPGQTARSKREGTQVPQLSAVRGGDPKTPEGRRPKDRPEGKGPKNPRDVAWASSAPGSTTRSRPVCSTSINRPGRHGVGSLR